MSWQAAQWGARQLQRAESLAEVASMGNASGSLFWDLLALPMPFSNAIQHQVDVVQNG